MLVRVTDKLLVCGSPLALFFMFRSVLGQSEWVSQQQSSPA